LKKGIFLPKSKEDACQHSLQDVKFLALFWHFLFLK